MSKLAIVFLAFFAASLMVASHARVVVENENGNVIDVTETPQKPILSDLEEKILLLKEKVKNLVEQGKQNEKAFLSMSEKVRSMDSKVRDMTERLQKINKADYLNSGAEEIKNI